MIRIRMNYIVCVISVIVMLGATAYADDAGEQRVGVVSLLGEQLELSHIGALFLTSRQMKLLVDSWGIDEDIVQSSQLELSELPGIKPVSVQYSYDWFSAVYNSGTRRMTQSYDPVEMNEQIRSLAVDHGLDVVILIMGGEMLNPISGSTDVRGYGLARKKSGSDKSTFIYLSANVKVLDARSLMMLDEFDIRKTEQIPNHYWKSQRSDMSAELQVFMADWVKRSAMDGIKANLRIESLIKNSR